MTENSKLLSIINKTRQKKMEQNRHDQTTARFILSLASGVAARATIRARQLGILPGLSMTRDLTRKQDDVAFG